MISRCLNKGSHRLLLHVQNWALAVARLCGYSSACNTQQKASQTPGCGPFTRGVQTPLAARTRANVITRCRQHEGWGDEFLQNQRLTPPAGPAGWAEEFDEQRAGGAADWSSDFLTQQVPILSLSHPAVLHSLSLVPLWSTRTRDTFILVAWCSRNHN